MEQRGWLPAAVRVVREGADRATEPGGVVETVPGDLVESGLAAVAWVAQAGPQRDRVRVRAASVTTPEWVSVSSDGPVARALEEDAVTHTSAVAETAVYGAVAEGEALPEVTAGLFVPFRTLGQAGVLALLTDGPRLVRGPRDSRGSRGSPRRQPLAGRVEGRPRA